MDLRLYYLFLVTILVCLWASGCVAILCYQCADTTDDENLAPCFNKPHHLVNQKKLHEKGEPLKNLHRLKNCSHYLDNRGEFVYRYCKVEKIQAHGVTNAFLRDCSDGMVFGLNVTRLQQVKPDNQTICGYSQRHVANICISVCNQDFCNGPSAASAIMTSVMTLISTVLMGIFGKKMIC